MPITHPQKVGENRVQANSAYLEYDEDSGTLTLDVTNDHDDRAVTMTPEEFREAAALVRNQEHGVVGEADVGDYGIFADQYTIRHVDKDFHGVAIESWFNENSTDEILEAVGAV